MAGRFRIFSIDADTTCSISGLKISGGDVAQFGGAIFNLGNLTLTGCDLIYNHADISGGAVYNAGTLIASGCYLNINSAGTATSDGAGGGFYSQNGLLQLYNTTVEGNTSTAKGGGIYIDSGTLQIQITDSSKIIDNNAYWEGGGIYILHCDEFSMSGGSITYNHATGNGDTAKGGGLYIKSGSDITLTNVSLTYNSAEGYGGNGGGFYIKGGLLQLAACTISNNSATGLGPGGAYMTPGDYTSDAQCTITDDIVDDE